MCPLHEQKIRVHCNHVYTRIINLLQIHPNVLTHKLLDRCKQMQSTRFHFHLMFQILYWVIMQIVFEPKSLDWRCKKIPWRINSYQIHTRPLANV